MLPFLLASVFGIIVFGFNIIYVNVNKTYAIDYSLLIDSQNRNARANGANVNSSLDANAESKRNSISASVDLLSRKSQNAAKTETEKANNLKINVPAGGTQPRRALVKKPEPGVNVLENTRKQNWLIQAGVFSIESSAVKVKNKIASYGYGVEIIKIGTDKPLFKVMVSAGNSGVSPSDALKRLSSDGIEGFIIAGRP